MKNFFVKIKNRTELHNVKINWLFQIHHVLDRVKSNGVTEIRCPNIESIQKIQYIKEEWKRKLEMLTLQFRSRSCEKSIESMMYLENQLHPSKEHLAHTIRVKSIP